MKCVVAVGTRILSHLKFFSNKKTFAICNFRFLSLTLSLLFSFIFNFHGNYYYLPILSISSKSLSFLLHLDGLSFKLYLVWIMRKKFCNNHFFSSYSFSFNFDFNSFNPDEKIQSFFS